MNYRIRIGLLLLPLLVAFSCSEQKSVQKKIVFMDSFRVFEEFEMKKDLDQKLEKEIQPEKRMVDELGLKLNVEQNPKLKAELQSNFEIAKGQFDQRFQSLSNQYTNDVTKRLNEYIKEYGKQKHYDLILGTDGQGNVMYIDTNSNITVDLIKFINKEYKK